MVSGKSSMGFASRQKSFNDTSSKNIILKMNFHNKDSETKKEIEKREELRKKEVAEILRLRKKYDIYYNV